MHGTGLITASGQAVLKLHQLQLHSQRQQRAIHCGVHRLRVRSSEVWVNPHQHYRLIQHRRSIGLLRPTQILQRSRRFQLKSCSSTFPQHAPPNFMMFVVLRAEHLPTSEAGDCFCLPAPEARTEALNQVIKFALHPAHILIVTLTNNHHRAHRPHFPRRRRTSSACSARTAKGLPQYHCRS